MIDTSYADINKKIESVAGSPAHALLIIGQSSDENLKLARTLSKKILSIERLDNYPYLLELVSPDKKPIGIEDIRKIGKFLSLKISSKKAVSRIVIIENAHLMRLEAQNALLKILEEPPLNTVLILESTKPSMLLPTVVSRMSKIHNIPPNREQLRNRFSSYDDSEFNRAYSISQNQTGLLEQLLEDDDHPLLSSAKDARAILTGTIYERLILVDELAKNPAKVQEIIYILQRMANISLSSSKKPNAKWQQVLISYYEAQEELNKKAQTKLVLINLFINL